MKKLLTLVFIALAFSHQAHAIPPYFNSNTSTERSVIPLNPEINTSFVKRQDIYGPGEFAGAPKGQIISLWIRMSSASDAGPYTDFEISMGQNVGTTTTVNTLFNSNLTSVLSSSALFIPAVAVGDWVVFPLLSSFPYNPALSLVIEIKSKGTSGDGVNVYRGTGENKSVYGPYVSPSGNFTLGPIDIGLSIRPSLVFENSFEQP